LPDLGSIAERLGPLHLLAALALVLAVGALVSWARARRDIARADTAKRAAEERVTRLETQIKELGRQMARKERDRDTVANLALSLPHVVRELNREDLELRKIPELITNLADSIFRPQQILLWLSSPLTGGNGEPRHLVLRAQKGLTELPDALQRIAVGDGKIGWVAQHRLERQQEDWLQLARTDALAVRDNHPALLPDLVGPLVHHTVNGEEVLGVLSLGQPSLQPRNEKLMLQMVTNLGSLALVNAINVARLREQANHDGLTGLLTKRFFLHRLSELMVEHANKAQRLALFIFDIDHFKTYNDTNGHPAGDQLLRSLAALLRSSMRAGDWCCRYGGEEFMVAMPQTDPDEAIAQAEVIRAAIEAQHFEHQEKQPSGNLTISGGVAVFPHDGGSLEELIQNADDGLYASKRAGRNRVSRQGAAGIGEPNHEPMAGTIPARAER